MAIGTILTVFIVAATGGLTLAYLVFKNKRRPILLAGLHGIIALAAFAFLIYYSSIGFQLGGNSDTPYASLLFFSIAATGGLYLFFRDKFLKTGIKKWMVLAHGGAAIMGIISLIIFIYFN